MLIVQFAREHAVSKIQKYYRAYLEDKKERERIAFEQAKKRCRKNLARATLRKYITIYLLKKKEQRENLEFHEKYHLDKIIHLQIKYRAWKARPNKLNVSKFKQTFHGALLGWKIRRIINYLNSVPTVREAIDYIKLRNDIEDPSPTDAFSKQIIEKYPDMVNIFQTNFNDLIENAVWIKKPVSKSPTFSKTGTKKTFKERSKPSKIPAKPVKKKDMNVNRRNTVKAIQSKSKPEESKKPRNSMKKQIGGATHVKKKPSVNGGVEVSIKKELEIVQKPKALATRNGNIRLDNSTSELKNSVNKTKKHTEKPKKQ